MSPEQRELALLGAKVLGMPAYAFDDACPPSMEDREYPHVWLMRGYLFPPAPRLIQAPDDDKGTAWSPSTDLNQAWEVAEKVGHTVRLEQERGGHAVATLWPGPPAYGQVTVRAETRPLALMKAVQAALSGGDQL